MRRSRGMSRLFLFVVAVALIIIAAGCIRYGGPEGLVRRINSEVRSLQSHPNFVPTPLPAADLAVMAQPRHSAPQNPQRFTNALPVVEVPQVATEAVQPSIDAPPTVAPTPLHQPASASVQLSGFSHEWQTWNNCGPATLAMNLSYYGSTLTQADIGAVLRTHEDDKNVIPEELAAFAQAQGYEAHIFVNGDDQRMKLLLSNGIPVFIETWLEEDPNDGMGHYRLLTGYDDAVRQWIAFDSYVSHNLLSGDRNTPYTGIYIPYDEIATMWPVFNRTYLLVYPAAQRPLVESILGADMESAAMWQRALTTAQAEVQQNVSNPFAWFNMGSSLVRLGDYANAAAAFDHARQIGLPWRMLWYQFGPFEAYYYTGRFQEIVALADATIATTKSVEDLYYWKGQAQAALGDVAGARQSWQRALALNPRYVAAQQALNEHGG